MTSNSRSSDSRISKFSRAIFSPANSKKVGISTGEVKVREASVTGSFSGTGAELINNPQEITQTAIKEKVTASFGRDILYFDIFYYFQSERLDQSAKIVFSFKADKNLQKERKKDWRRRILEVISDPSEYTKLHRLDINHVVDAHRIHKLFNSGFNGKHELVPEVIPKFKTS